MLKIYYGFYNHVAVFLGTIYVFTGLSKMSLSKDSSGSEFSVDDNLYFRSVSSACSQLYCSLKGEYFVEDCLLTRWAKSTSSIMDGHFNRFSSNNFTREFFIVLFCLSTKPFGLWVIFSCGWYSCRSLP